MIRYSIRSVVLALAALLLAAPALAKSAHPSVVATVNGTPIPQSRADALIAAQVAQGQPDSPELRQAVRRELIRRELLAQQAHKIGLDKRPQIEAQMALARQSVLIAAYMREYLRTHPITDAAVKKEYDAVKARLGTKEYKARHILVPTEKQAKAIIAKLDKGAKFADLAKESTDSGSKNDGGELGWAPPSNYVQPFAKALVKLHKGQYTETPVKTQFGYHIIKLDDVRPLKLPTLEKVKPRLVQELQQQMVANYLRSLLSKAKIH